MGEMSLSQYMHRRPRDIMSYRETLILIHILAMEGKSHEPHITKCSNQAENARFGLLLGFMQSPPFVAVLKGT